MVLGTNQSGSLRQRASNLPSNRLLLPRVSLEVRAKTCEMTAESFDTQTRFILSACQILTCKHAVCSPYHRPIVLTATWCRSATLGTSIQDNSSTTDHGKSKLHEASRDASPGAQAREFKLFLAVANQTWPQIAFVFLAQGKRARATDRIVL